MSTIGGKSCPGNSSKLIDDEDQMNNLLSKLQRLLPQFRTRHSDKALASEVLQETCNYIRDLHQEADNLSDRISQILAAVDADSNQAAIIRGLLA